MSKSAIKLFSVLMVLIGSFAFGQDKHSTQSVELFMSNVEKTTELLINKKIGPDETKLTFENLFKGQGISIIEDYFIDDRELSGEYKSICLNIVSADKYETESDYLNHLMQIERHIGTSRLTEKEKQLAQVLTDFERQLVIKMQNLNDKYGSVETGKKGWWKSWGKCVASSLGGAITGGVVGCGAIGGIGAIVGTVVPGPGNAVGAAAGCIGGGIAGAIGGGLSGAALGC